MLFATLAYLRDECGRYLLMRRETRPNVGLWSPPGGKYEHGLRESLHESAAREIREEVLVAMSPTDLALRGVSTERGAWADGTLDDYMLFHFEGRVRAGDVPERGPEGAFRWFAPGEILEAAIPDTDRKVFWPRILAGLTFFAVTIERDGEFVRESGVEEERG